MVQFEVLGFESLDAYKRAFLGGLLESDKTFSYFVDWEKVKRNVLSNLEELSLLNTLTRVEKEKRKEYLKSLLKKYPKVLEVIPLLIAERVKDSKIDIFDPETGKICEYIFKAVNGSKPEDAVGEEGKLDRIVYFCEQTGILSLFDEIRDLYDYLMGIEVGLDSNARKNRSGEIFEEMCKKKVKEMVNELQRERNLTCLSVEYNDQKFSLFSSTSESKGHSKIHDMVIYMNDGPILVVECSFYNVGGSKPISIAESYIELNKEAKNKGVNFLWITDGPAWKHMNKVLEKALKELDWILNYRMLGLFKNILLKIIEEKTIK